MVNGKKPKRNCFVFSRCEFGIRGAIRRAGQEFVARVALPPR